MDRGEMDGVKEGKEIEARLHFAGITISGLAPALLMSGSPDWQVRPTSILTIRLTCLSSPLLPAAIAPSPQWHPHAL